MERGDGALECRAWPCREQVWGRANGNQRECGRIRDKQKPAREAKTEAEKETSACSGSSIRDLGRGAPMRIPQSADRRASRSFSPSPTNTCTEAVGEMEACKDTGMRRFWGAACRERSDAEAPCERKEPASPLAP